MSKRINAEQVLVNMMGEELTHESLSAENEVEKSPLTLKKVLVNSILHPKNEDEKTSGEHKLARFTLAQAIQGADPDVDIGNTDIAMIKNLVNKVNSAMIVGQVYNLLADAPNVG